ncbi:extracellular solute-binding protein [Cellulomonas sp. zg-ZUI222]|uniref:Extracellular solute-binding protein n=1 Tax=Cellulomonas wangleii TaxID=2816956 RepID=A0ABX8D716_9CELL|nr:MULTISPECIES: extracellular solute-binding protein [Cellulomonas]MBO0899214.1 extracellular solute-binding protein [Cellulomonas sp. zg-ZUI22]MBO0920064.1 extracellular solute-binding protein [Cellulomonas wangleii]MBO0923507.1 extracellular solute-binding protein [Cellulomonas wangleii]QVI61847.1 extracellular solute-binding protein [Cellulomonas wangleii]
MKVRKTLAATAAVLMGALALTACGGSDDNAGGGDGGDAELTFWHNSTTGDGKAYWEATAAAFEEANPGVTIKIQSIQNEDMDGKLQTALNSGDAPDIFMARGGGKLADIVDSGQVMDLTDKVDDDVREAVGGALDAFKVDGKIYGMPTAVLPGGIWYSKDLFAQAGITETPKTMAELEDAVAKLKAAGVQPIALGAKDAWPAAHWYYFFALRACSQDTINESAAEMNFDDPCWAEAGKAYEEFAGVEPFNNGFLTTTAQQGAGSSAGLLANHQAAMELMGAWNPGVIAGLTPDGEPLADLGWFPFPAIEGGEGDATAMMGGVDGYACHVDAPDVCADFLNFYMGQEHQEGYAEAFVTLPASKDAQGAVTDPALQDVLASYNDAAYVSVWLDTLLGQNVGNALNGAVVEMLAGNGDADSIVSTVQAAAAKE